MKKTLLALIFAGATITAHAGDLVETYYCENPDQGWAVSVEQELGNHQRGRVGMTIPGSGYHDFALESAGLDTRDVEFARFQYIARWSLPRSFDYRPGGARAQTITRRGRLMVQLADLGNSYLETSYGQRIQLRCIRTNFSTQSVPCFE